MLVTHKKNLGKHTWELTAERERERERDLYALHVIPSPNPIFTLKDTITEGYRSGSGGERGAGYDRPGNDALWVELIWNLWSLWTHCAAVLCSQKSENKQLAIPSHRSLTCSHRTVIRLLRIARSLRSPHSFAFYALFALVQTLCCGHSFAHSLAYSLTPAGIVRDLMSDTQALLKDSA